MFVLVLTSILLLFTVGGHAFAKQHPDKKEPYEFLLGGEAIVLAKSAPVPSGYFGLCKDGKSPVCQLLPGSFPVTRDGAVRLTKRLVEQLVSLNAAVNAAIRPLSDMQHFGVADRWSVSPKAGDCEDYAITKKARLLKTGWPSSALLVALAVTSGGEQHAVLIVRTDRGDVVLDNLTAKVRGWTPSLYRWKAVQSPTDVWGWKRIGPAGAKMAAAGPLPDDDFAVTTALLLPASDPSGTATPKHRGRTNIHSGSASERPAQAAAQERIASADEGNRSASSIVALGHDTHAVVVASREPLSRLHGKQRYVLSFAGRSHGLQFGRFAALTAGARIAVD